MPNAWDIGSARILASLGFEAIATTSSGHAASLGRMDQHVTLDELVDHAAALVGSVDVPVSIDAERCFGEDPDGVAAAVRRLAATGASGVSIEDYDPRSGVDQVDVAARRVEAAASVTRLAGMTLTARAENHLYDVDDLEDTIRRLVAYRDAGADVVYAPGLADLGQIEQVVRAVRAPVNVLALRGGPRVADLADVGVRRISTGGALTFAAYGALAEAARELLDAGTSEYAGRALTMEDRRAAFDG
jgi:2-methylisocitrate lyase-like PEP mutase family enzyme